MRKRKIKFDPLNYDEDKMGRYHVEAFDEKGNKVDQMFVDAINRRMAYYDVMGKMKPHVKFNSTRIANL